MAEVPATAWVRRILGANLPTALALALALVAPDFLMPAIADSPRAVYTADIAAYLLLFALCASLAAPSRLIAGFLIVLGAFEVVAACYMAYFGGVIDANLIIQGFMEAEDVAVGGLGVWRYLLYAPLVVVVPYVAAWLVVRRLNGARVVIPGGWLALLLAGAIVPSQIVRAGNAVHYYPVDTLPSAANSYLTFAALFFNHLPAYLADADGNAGRYRPVSVTRGATPERATIVIILNESLTSDHMSLFGYARDTTPRLMALRGDSGFVAREGIAAGVGTNPALHSLWNEVRDPRDERAFIEQRANLFRLAREAGFRTSYLSAQRANLLRGDGMQFVDVLQTVESQGPLYERLHDEMFIELIKSMHLAEKNLIVLQLRSAHGPFAQNYDRRPELAIFPTEGLRYRKYQRNAYDNAVRYNDFIMSGLIDHFRATTTGPLYVFMTSDHGQLLGDHGSRLFGHGMLLPEVARVPIMLYTRDGDPAVADALRSMATPTHYELTRLVDRILGYEVLDPNAEDGVYYINGAGYNALSGYIRVETGGSGPPRFKSFPAGKRG